MELDKTDKRIIVGVLSFFSLSAIVLYFFNRKITTSGNVLRNIITKKIQLPTIGILKNDQTNVLKYALLESPIVGTLTRNDEVSVNTATDANYYAITVLNGKNTGNTGYISKTDVVLTGVSPSIKPTGAPSTTVADQKEIADIKSTTPPEQQQKVLTARQYCKAKGLSGESLRTCIVDTKTNMDAIEAKEGITLASSLLEKIVGSV